MTAGPTGSSLVLRVRRLPGHEDLELPRLASTGASGLDLPAAVSGALEIAPGERVLVPCGLAVEIPVGWEGQVRPRSGLAVRNGVTVLNAPGTIDSDYRGEVKVLLVNHGGEPYEVGRGDRIAQLVLSPVAHGIDVVEAEDLTSTDRGAGGFGSTGA